jgi:hypothetical protein
MAISTYAELQTAVTNWLVSAHTNLSSRVTECIALAEAEINRVLRVRQMEASADVTISARTAALPTGFMAMRRLYLSLSPVQFLSFLPSEEFWERLGGSDTGRPLYYTLEGDDFVFGPAPDTTYTGKCLYWKRQDISASNHNLFVQNPDLYLFGSLLHTVGITGWEMNDPKLLTWKEGFMKALEQIRAADVKDRHSGSVLQARPYPVAV